jgi:hypothetical protein
VKGLERRLQALEGGRGHYLMIGELLDRLDAPVDDGRWPDPRMVRWLDALEGR